MPYAEKFNLHVYAHTKNLLLKSIFQILRKVLYVIFIIGLFSMLKIFSIFVHINKIY